MSYEHLLSPGRIGTLETRNRIVMAPMGSNLCEPDGTPGDRMTAYFEARARGGVGLVIVEVAAIAWPVGAANPNQLGISNDAFIPHLARLTERIHAHGAKAALQLQHAGKVATRDIAAGRPMWVPSTPVAGAMDLFADLTAEDRNEALRDYFQPGAKAEYHEMTHDDIAQMRHWFTDAVVRARAAGFDAVELHAGHGYVLSAFLSPHSNRRTDEYGGPLEARARLLVEVIADARAAVGNDFPMWCRMDGTEFDVPDGITLDDACRTAALAIDAGLDAVHVSAYADPGSGKAFTRAPLVHEPAGFVHLARAVKRSIDAPVIAVGRIDPDAGNQLIADGDIDFVAMGRKLLADPELPNKLARDQRQSIRPCIYSYRCVGNVFLTRGARCTVNASTGREHELVVELVPADVVRHVVVVGGGPGGLETARIAAARGHRVTVLERAMQVGGRARLAARVEPAIGELVAWLEHEVEHLGVDVRVGVDADAEVLRSFSPDAVVIATGARVPNHDADLAALLERDDIADRPITIVGANGVAALVAASLAQRGARVTLVSERDTFGIGLSPPRLWRTMDALRTNGVELLNNASRPVPHAGESDVVVVLDPWEPSDPFAADVA
ncbi:MAG: putative NADH-dependent oxidoreductase, partial [Actinomycetia bacterium]|nr:putative NADH-dependent oxidoreductase [Actinomycetes bacterium]